MAHNKVGDLVPVQKKAPGHVSGGKRLDALIEELQRKSPWENSSKGWQVLSAPLGEADQAPLEAPAFTCVVSTWGAVGVLKIASNDGCAANCTLFVRLKRSVLDAWCDANAQPKHARRAFRRALDAKQAADLLSGMQAYCLKPGRVHHPQALSVLALMTHAGWLTLPTVETCHPPTTSGTFTLVALPPADPNLEQCLTLLGHKSTFKAKSTAKVSDSDDEDTPLSSRIDEAMWGPTHGAVVCSQWVSKFKEASRVFNDYANPKLLSTYVPRLNELSPDCARVLSKTCTLFAAGSKEASGKATAPPPAQPKPKEKPAIKKPQKKADKKADSAPTANGLVELAPSDISDNDADDAPAGKAPAPASASASASSSSSRQKGKAAKGRGEKRKSRNPDSDEGSEDEESAASSAQSSSEEEEDGEEEDVEAVASDRATSDDDDEDDDDDDEDSSSGSAKPRPKEKPKAKKQRVAEGGDTLPEAAHAFAAELAAKDEALCASMREIAAQSFEDVWAWRDGANGPAMSKESACQASQDLGDIQKAKSPIAVVAAMSTLVKTLAKAHDEHFQGGTCEVRTAEVTRLHDACTRATEFSEATLEEMDKAIEGLTKARDLGRRALERMAPPRAPSA